MRSRSSLASDVPTFEACASHAGAHSLDDQVAFQFRDRSYDDHDGAAERPPVSICSRNEMNSMPR